LFLPVSYRQRFYYNLLNEFRKNLFFWNQQRSSFLSLAHENHKRFISTVNKRKNKLVSPLNAKNSGIVYWKKLTSLDKNSPTVLVNNFLQKYPTPILAKKNLNIKLIKSIFKSFIPDFKLTSAEFNILINIESFIYKLPLNQPLTELFGQPRRGRGNKIPTLWRAGVYKLSNKINGSSYIGSSLNLASRLSEYFRPKLKNKRVVELEVSKLGIENFELEVWFLPLEWLVSKVKLVEDSSALATDLVINSKEGKELATLVKVNVEQLRNLALALEQMLILVYNPEYNTLKVAGGTVAGLTRKAESMIPAAEKNRKITYFYDMFNKKLIYVADSRSKLSKVLNMSKGFFSNYINKRYLDRFYITNTLYCTMSCFAGKWYSYISNSLLSAYAALSCPLSQAGKWYNKVWLFNISRNRISYYRYRKSLGLFNRSLVIKKINELTQRLPKNKVNRSKHESGGSPFYIILKGRSYSTLSPSGVVPVKIYSNADLYKSQILKENKGKSGVYRWVNLANGKSYIGSSVDLAKRLRNYFNISYLEREIKMSSSVINRALLKHGYSNFSLEILEYCDPDTVVSKEQYYFDVLRPEYNILPSAASRYGSKHSPETIAKLKGRTWTLTPEQKAHQLKYLKILYANPEFRTKQIEQSKIYNLSQAHQEHLKKLNSSQEHQEHLKRIWSLISHQVEVLDTLTNETTVYTSISEAARAIGVSHASISAAFKRQKEKGVSTILIKKRYKITKLSRN
jgi:group I intron endonuclease